METTLAVGAYDETSAATGVDGNQTKPFAAHSGAVYVFSRKVNGWAQSAYIKASNAEADDLFGWALSLSKDGTTLAVGAHGEGSKATGVNGDQTDNSAFASGAAYVFRQHSGIWTQEAYIKASNTRADSWFGRALKLSGDGTTLAVAAHWEQSNATGINGDQSDSSLHGAGAVYVYTNNAGQWQQEAYVKASNTAADDYFGMSLALNYSGDTLAVGAHFEDSDATDVNGNQNSDKAENAGAAYVFQRSAGLWTQEAYLKASNTRTEGAFGRAVALSDSGNTLAVSAIGEASAAPGVDGDQTDKSARFAGAVYLFQHAAGTWAQTTYIKASNPGAADYFGESIALSADGRTLAVGAIEEDSAATGIGGNQIDNSAGKAGAVYVFKFRSGTWAQQSYVKATNTGANDLFGKVALSADGSTLAVGASGESSNSIGIGGNPDDNSAASAGAVYLY